MKIRFKPILHLNEPILHTVDLGEMDVSGLIDLDFDEGVQFTELSGFLFLWHLTSITPGF